MLIVTTILSLVFIGIGFIVTENNAKYILSGYNSMSEEDRQRFDIKSYVPYFRNFHVFLGSSLFVISVVLFYFVSSVWGGIFMVTYPIAAYIYFVWKANRFLKGSTGKQRISTYIVMGFLFIIFLLIVFMFTYSLRDNKIEIKNQTLEISGDYGTKLNIADIKSIELVNELPEISSKINGFAIETIKKGSFKTKDGEKVKLLINSTSNPLILIVTKDSQKIYYSSKETSNEEICNQLKKVIIK
ncbi:DUF3784 domain-containing protein [Pedobacter sp. B4-66]|uniref:DUF3784 domain-containing protein n=1 Tax=Pedobacter sp. B4-66 TaxID=2817280 RepID=UPI001BDA169B|nr:DUF3784 domain-containing protein [Pedobacter sp. B4-66]